MLHTRMACCRCNKTGSRRRCLFKGKQGLQQLPTRKTWEMRQHFCYHCPQPPWPQPQPPWDSAATLPASADGSHLGSYLGREDLTNVSGSVALPGMERQMGQKSIFVYASIEIACIHLRAVLSRIGYAYSGYARCFGAP